MHSNYSDIRERILEQPTWYDRNGCPRYGKFDPELCPNIYATVVVLLRIACQYCHAEFSVEMHTDPFTFIRGDELTPKKWHYGDPPVHGCVGGGDTMNCDDLEVLEVWLKPHPCENWIRLPALEGKIEEGARR